MAASGVVVPALPRLPSNASDRGRPGSGKHRDSHRSSRAGKSSARPRGSMVRNNSKTALAVPGETLTPELAAGASVGNVTEMIAEDGHDDTMGGESSLSLRQGKRQSRASTRRSQVRPHPHGNLSFCNPLLLSSFRAGSESTRCICTACAVVSARWLTVACARVRDPHRRPFGRCEPAWGALGRPSPRISTRRLRAPCPARPRPTPPPSC